MSWSPTISAARIVEFREWVAKVAKIDNVLTETREVVRRMSLWSNGSTTGNNWQVQVAERGADLPKLSEMSFKKGVEWMARQLVQVGEESQRLYREDNLREWRGTFSHGQWYFNADFDTKTG